MAQRKVTEAGVLLTMFTVFGGLLVAPYMAVWIFHDSILAVARSAGFALVTQQDQKTLYLLLMATPSLVMGGVLLLETARRFGGAWLASHAVPDTDSRVGQAQASLETHVRDVIEQADVAEHSDLPDWDGHLHFRFYTGLGFNLRPGGNLTTLSELLPAGTQAPTIAQILAGTPAFSGLSKHQRLLLVEKVRRTPWISQRPRYSAHQRLALRHKTPKILAA